LEVDPFLLHLLNLPIAIRKTRKDNLQKLAGLHEVQFGVGCLAFEDKYAREFFPRQNHLASLVAITPIVNGVTEP